MAFQWRHCHSGANFLSPLNGRLIGPLLRTAEGSPGSVTERKRGCEERDLGGSAIIGYGITTGWSIEQTIFNSEREGAVVTVLNRERESSFIGSKENTYWTFSIAFLSSFYFFFCSYVFFITPLSRSDDTASVPRALLTQDVRDAFGPEYTFRQSYKLPSEDRPPFPALLALGSRYFFLLLAQFYFIFVFRRRTHSAEDFNDLVGGRRASDARSTEREVIKAKIRAFPRLLKVKDRTLGETLLCLGYTL